MTVDQATLARIPQLAARYRAGELSPAEYAAYYVLYWQLARHAERSTLRRSRFDPKPDASAWLTQLDQSPPPARTALLIDLLDRHDLREVRRRVNLALIGWLRGEWNVTLCQRVPTVRDVLRMQARGTRPVTVIADYPRLLDPVLEKPNAFAFICHDLEHAWQFFHDPEQHESQRRLAQQLDQAIDQGVFTRYLADATFAEKFDYLAADMNTHIAHSLQYLRAILLEFHLRDEGKDLRDQLSPPSREKVNGCIARLTDALGLVDSTGTPISLALTASDAAY